jgi:hypothetical protein
LRQNWLPSSHSRGGGSSILAGVPFLERIRFFARRGLLVVGFAVRALRPFGRPWHILAQLGKVFGCVLVIAARCSVPGGG